MVYTEHAAHCTPLYKEAKKSYWVTSLRSEVMEEWIRVLSWLITQRQLKILFSPGVMADDVQCFEGSYKR